jgi:hypothetical protein
LYSVRSISTVLSMVPSGSYPHALLNRLPILARCSRFEQDVATQNAGTGPFARLRAGAVSFVRERLRKVSAVAVGPSPASVFGGEFAARAFKVTQDEGLTLKKTLATVARFVARR